MTERDGQMTPKAFHALFGRIGARAKMRIQRTVRYTELAPDQFKNFWR
jgi:hypothetical protein